MDKRWEAKLLSITHSKAISGREVIQSLWSGYGQIIRYHLVEGLYPSVVVKHILTPSTQSHPRGWNTDTSHQRKLRSYKVETCWYADWSRQCGATCRVPECYDISNQGESRHIVLEDLDAAGYSLRETQPAFEQIYLCLDWLAEFHATFMGKIPRGIWETGTYWHLNTRPDELSALEDVALKTSAAEIDRILNATPYRTFVHGDAKLANFCFSNKGDAVAAVDFQYVGGGCGMKDVAYFLGSCLNEAACEREADAMLDKYFERLRSALKRRGSALQGSAIEADWRRLYPYAWTDFHRFIKGWSPGHWKINSYSERLAAKVIEAIAESS